MDAKSTHLSSGDVDETPSSVNVTSTAQDTQLNEEEKQENIKKLPKSDPAKSAVKKQRSKLTENYKPKDTFPCSPSTTSAFSSNSEKKLNKKSNPKKSLVNSLELHANGKTIRLTLNEKLLTSLLREVQAKTRKAKKARMGSARKSDASLGYVVSRKMTEVGSKDAEKRPQGKSGGKRKIKDQNKKKEVTPIPQEVEDKSPTGSDK